MKGMEIHFFHLLDVFQTSSKNARLQITNLSKKFNSEKNLFKIYTITYLYLPSRGYLGLQESCQCFESTKFQPEINIRKK